MAKNKKFSNSFVIGIFVLLGLSILVAFVLWMGASQFFKEYNTYATYFNQSVEGLTSGSAVKYLGVQCGMIESVQIAPDGKLVEVIFKIDKSIKMNINSLIIKLEMAGLAGDKFLQLYISERKNINNNIILSFTPPHPLINSAPSSMEELTNAASDIVGNMQQIQWKEISDGLTGTLSGTNEFINNKELQLLVAELRASTTSVNELLNSVNQSTIVSDIAKTTSSISESANSINNLVGKVSGELGNVGIAQYIERAYVGYDTTVANANHAIALMTNRLETSLIGINALVEDLAVTNKNLQKTIRILNDSPYLLLTEPPPPDKIKK